MDGTGGSLLFKERGDVCACNEIGDDGGLERAGEGDKDLSISSRYGGSGSGSNALKELVPVIVIARLRAEALVCERDFDEFFFPFGIVTSKYGKKMEEGRVQGSVKRDYNQMLSIE